MYPPGFAVYIALGVMKATTATIEDASPIADVHIRSWQAAYAEILDPEFLAALSVESRTARWQAILSANDSTTLVVRQGSEISGFVNFGKCRDAEAPGDQGEIHAIYVAPSAWGKGVGRELMIQAMNELRALGFLSVSLWVLSNNLRSIRFYESFGFERVPSSMKLTDVGGRQVEEVIYVRHDA